MSGWNFPGGAVVKNVPCSARDTDSIPGWELGSHMLQGNQACLLQLRPDAVKFKTNKQKTVANVKKDISCSMYMLKYIVGNQNLEDRILQTLDLTWVLVFK